MENKVQVIDKNEGTKIPFEQDGTKLFFDDDIMINVKKYQKDWPVEVDVMYDENRNLTIGESGVYYVAQIFVPAIEYIDVEPEEEDEEPKKEPVPLDMGDVVLTLWRIDDFQI